jgi:hypothetical protein
MGRTTVSICLIAKSSMNVVSLQVSRAALLGALFVVASLPAATLAGVAGGSRESTQPDPSIRPGRGRQLVLQIRGSG